MTETLPPLAASARTVEPTTYDCILLAGFGGPEGQDDVIPYLRNVTITDNTELLPCGNMALQTPGFLDASASSKLKSSFQLPSCAPPLQNAAALPPAASRNRGRPSKAPRGS